MRDGDDSRKIIITTTVNDVLDLLHAANDMCLEPDMLHEFVLKGADQITPEEVEAAAVAIETGYGEEDVEERREAYADIAAEQMRRRGS